MNLKKRKHFIQKKEGSFLMTLFLSYYFSYQTRKDLVLIKFYYNAAVRHFLKTFRKFAGKRLWMRLLLGGLFVFLSVFRTPFYGCFQKLSGNTLLWMITLFGANTSESSKICQKKEDFSYQMPRNTYARDFSFSLRANFMYFLKCIPLKKNPWNLQGFFVKISSLRIS